MTNLGRDTDHNYNADPGYALILITDHRRQRHELHRILCSLPSFCFISIRIL